MAAMTFKLTGDKRLDRKFAALPMKVEKKILRQALRPAAKLILDSARQNAPVDTGALRKSLAVRAGKRTRKGTVRVQVQTSDGMFTGKTFYGAFQELGHHRGKRSLGSGRPMIPGKHYIKRAFDSRKFAAQVLAQSLIAEGILREARSGGG